jgi:hypothetical protein
VAKRIPLTCGKFAIVDDEDYDRLSKWKWQYHRGAAHRKQHIARIGGKQIVRMIQMHRFINNTPPSMETDHINGDPLDNRKANLRTATPNQNKMNRGKTTRKCTSRFKGVSWNAARGSWRADITLSRKQIHLGHFSDEIAAATAYNAAAKKYHGEFAKLNLLDGASA